MNNNKNCFVNSCRIGLILLFGAIGFMPLPLTLAQCYKQNAACKDGGGSGGSARKAYSDQVRTTLAYIYCKSSQYQYQRCVSCGSYDNVYYKETVEDTLCTGTVWIDAGSAGPSIKYCTDNDCST